VFVTEWRVVLGRLGRAMTGDQCQSQAEEQRKERQWQR
jgi:hypothetical protein